MFFCYCFSHVFCSLNFPVPMFFLTQDEEFEEADGILSELRRKAETGQPVGSHFSHLYILRCSRICPDHTYIILINNRYLSIYPSIHLSIYPSIYPSIHLVKFHRHCACGVVLFHRCLTFVLLSNCPSIVHDRCIVFLWQFV